MQTARRLYRFRGLALAATLIAMACSADPQQPPPMNNIAEQYVRLILAIGEHDPNYVDAYYGPDAWKSAGKVALGEIASRIERLTADLSRVPASSDEMELLRRDYLTRQLASAASRVQMLQGTRFSFDAESQALYDAVAPSLPEAHFQQLLLRLQSELPGKGPLAARYEAFRSRYVIPAGKLDGVFRTAIAACRERTLRRITLPPGETFTVEYVTGKSWSAYNWYKGGFRSVIQVNTDLPVHIDRAVDLACHEGYPGHHVYNTLLEKHLVKDRGWMEFTVYPLFSPQSLIAEGTANYGIDVAFPGAERREFERTTLFPAAGLDPAGVDRYYEIADLVAQLAYAGNEAARWYLDGKIAATAAADWLERYTLASRPRAEQRVRFIEQYRSYVINYNLGMDMTEKFIEGRAKGDPARRWDEFGRLLSSPRLPSGLQ